ncbi:MAG: M1 family aminopeptidase [Ferruginibacter sp.]
MQKIYSIVITLIMFSTAVSAQFLSESKDTTWKTNYRASETRIHDVVHTKLDVRFDFDKAWLYGQEWLTLKPTWYPTDSLLLDAKGMEIREVALMQGSKKTALKYTYDGMQLRINLGKQYTAKESYTMYFNYISKPNDLKVEGSAAITDAKGLYFINPDGKTKNKPTQIWTQGETESNSAWMITIDKPNQKSTQELTMTVPAKYVTLSNGLLTSQKNNRDGTRSDTWKMDQPHAPYLFFMGVGEYSIITETYKNKEVSYYVEKEYAPYAKGIFGATPDMMGYFSKILGVEFPWSKYAQFVGRDYVSGAMENTTATIHGEGAYQNARQLKDGNGWEETIAHELFHQWFGDLVTTESWSNLTVNESFANYSEYLWNEYRYGKDAADEHHFNDMNGYLMSNSDKKDLVRFHYQSREDMFDAVSYNKGGRILHMLRNLVGDSAFFKALNLYLTSRAYKTGEAHHLRLAFEDVTGKDLNWFWNQWYFGNGHPKLDVSYDFETQGQAKVTIKQTQKGGKLFTLPIAVDVYENGKKTRHAITITRQQETFSLPTSGTPDWINVDADKILLAEWKDNKSEDQYKAQWKYATTFKDRFDAIDYFAAKKLPELANGLQDNYHGIRIKTINALSKSSMKNDPTVLSTIEKLARTEKNKRLKAAAIGFLASLKSDSYKSLFEAALNDSSYSVAGQALKGLAMLDADQGYSAARKQALDAKGTLGSEVISILLKRSEEADFGLIAGVYSSMPLNDEKFESTDKFLKFLTKINDKNNIRTGIDHVITLRNQIPEMYRSFVDSSFKPLFDELSKKGTDIEDYIRQSLQ